MNIYSFDGEPADTQTVLAMPELQGKNIVSIHYNRWRDKEGNDKGGRIDVEVEDSPAPILYVSDLFVSTPPINPDPEKALEETVKEMEKGAGNPKSLYIMLGGVTKYLKSKKNKLK